MKNDYFMKLFLYFLNVENIHIKFIKCRNDRFNYDWVYQNFNDCDPNEYIHSAFYWEDTIDGHEFWENKDIKWKKTLIKYRRLNKN